MGRLKQAATEIVAFAVQQYRDGVPYIEVNFTAFSSSRFHARAASQLRLDATEAKLTKLITQATDSFAKAFRMAVPPRIIKYRKYPHGGAERLLNLQPDEVVITVTRPVDRSEGTAIQISEVPQTGNGQIWDLDQVRLKLPSRP